MKMVESWNSLMIQKNDKASKVIEKGLTALSLALRQFLDKHIELERTARVANLLLKSGASKNNQIFKEIAEDCSTQQKNDGGWVGIEDSAWSVAFLKEYEEYSQDCKRGLDWIKEQQLKSGGWGKTNRDFGRIPVTGVVLYLLPELSNKDNLSWLSDEWKRESSINPKLTYKGAFTLMAFKRTSYQFVDINLFENTLSWLASEQNKDYGWGPCKGHPVGSTPFCTGVALTGLLQYPDKIDRNLIANGLKWIEKNQLEDGLWSDHYIEEGSAWSFYALTEGYKFLKERQ
ncbi:terpene cyclase/mutase family protein [Candidatus Bathyarchaeota archaeon]|nr:terpene cyclase/mutase family protein [Candidatus Bathyarchaeota archaeon]